LYPPRSAPDSLTIEEVGVITELEQAENIIASGEADAVFLAHAMLRNPRWALMACKKLGHRIEWALPLDRGRTV
jgi:2,4-dienoyl-CoA reductase-like NADH-dependent reductase (Old Yellow Enzyme family)